MAIVWDENQLLSLLTHLEREVPLTSGTLNVISASIPENSFAGKVETGMKTFNVYLGMDMSMGMGIVNVFLGYIMALSYAESAWNEEMDPSTIVFMHEKVCEAMQDQNPEFAQELQELDGLLLEWYKATSTDAPEEDQFLSIYAEDDLTSGLFSSEEVDYGAN